MDLVIYRIKLGLGSRFGNRSRCNTWTTTISIPSLFNWWGSSIPRHCWFLHFNTIRFLSPVCFQFSGCRCCLRGLGRARGLSKRRRGCDNLVWRCFHPITHPPVRFTLILIYTLGTRKCSWSQWLNGISSNMFSRSSSDGRSTYQKQIQ